MDCSPSLLSQISYRWPTDTVPQGCPCSSMWPAHGSSRPSPTQGITVTPSYLHLVTSGHYKQVLQMGRLSEWHGVGWPPDWNQRKEHWDGIIHRANRRDLHSVTSFCEFDMDNNVYSDYWERFRCHGDSSGWIFLILLSFYFLSSFLSSSNNRKKKKKKKKEKKKRNCLEIFVHMWYSFFFHFSIFHIVKNNGNAWSLPCVPLNLQEKISFRDKFYLFSFTEQRYILL